MRYSLKLLLAIPTLVAIIFSMVIYSEEYYVKSYLYIEGWNSIHMERGETLNKRIPRRVSGTVYFPNGETADAIEYEQTIDGVNISSAPSCVVFSTDSTTRWHHKLTVKKVDQQMREFMERNPDLVATWAEVEVYTNKPDPKDKLFKKRRVSYTRFETYPPE